MLLLDTDVLSALRRPERHPRVAAWLMAQDEGALFVSAATIGEIARGVAIEARRDPQAGAVLDEWLDRTCLQFADRIVPFDAAAARVWGRLSAEIGHGGADLQIAATALVGGFTVATRNTRHYAPTGVALTDPFESWSPSTAHSISIANVRLCAKDTDFARCFWIAAAPF